MRTLLQLRELTQAAQQVQLVSTRLTLLYVVSAADLVSLSAHQVQIQSSCTAHMCD